MIRTLPKDEPRRAWEKGHDDGSGPGQGYLRNDDRPTRQGRPVQSGRVALAPSSPCRVAGRWTLMAERRFAALPRLGPQEGQQVGIELLLVRAGDAVGSARI